MKKYLRNNDGMAMPLVLIIMTICMILASAMAMFAYSSYMSVRWMNDEKKAYFLSRAGVEAAAHAYQNAVMKTDENYKDLSKYGQFSDIDKLVAIGEDGDAIITTNRVYLAYSSSHINDNNPMKGLELKTYASDEAAKEDPECIGYFDVEIGNGQDEITIKNGAGEGVKQATDVKVFKSTAVCNKKVQTMFGYISSADNVAPNELYDDNGFLTTDGITKDQIGQPGTSGKFVVTPDYIDYNTDIINNSDNRVQRFFKGAVKWIFKKITESDGEPGRNINIYVKQSDANLVLSKPKNSDIIKINPELDNFYTFATTGNLFLQDTGLLVNPNKWQYASIGLYGNEIVIDGDITMECFYTNPYSFWNPNDEESSFKDKLDSTFAMLGKRFRLGTVVLGDATVTGPSMSAEETAKAGLRCNGEPVPANKVFFNGDVYVKIYTQGAEPETYKVFKAGDMAYFYGAYKTSGTRNENEFESQGIDLLKYFTDAVVAGRDGFDIYGNSLKAKMRKVSELYYGGEENSYFKDGDVLVRKISVDYNSDGSIIVDGGNGSVRDIIQPSPVDASSITWGKPKVSNVFDN